MAGMRVSILRSWSTDVATRWAVFSHSMDGFHHLDILGRLLAGLCESLVGPNRSPRVMASIGVAIYGAFAIVVRLASDHLIGLASSTRQSLARFYLASHYRRSGPSSGLYASDCRARVFRECPGKIWWHGIVVFLKGFGFVAISAFFVLYLHDQNWAHAGLVLSAFFTRSLTLSSRF